LRVLTFYAFGHVTPIVARWRREKEARKNNKKRQDNAVSSKREGIAGACQILLSSV